MQIKNHSDAVVALTGEIDQYSTFTRRFVATFFLRVVVYRFLLFVMLWAELQAFDFKMIEKKERKIKPNVDDRISEKDVRRKKSFIECFKCIWWFCVRFTTSQFTLTCRNWLCIQSTDYLYTTDVVILWQRTVAKSSREKDERIGMMFVLRLWTRQNWNSSASTCFHCKWCVYLRKIFERVRKA